MADRELRLELKRGGLLPVSRGWMLVKGFVVVRSWSSGSESFALSIWGPGEIVVPELIGIPQMEIEAISDVVAEEYRAGPVEQQSFLALQMEQMGRLMQLARIRPVDERMLAFMHWLAMRFGRAAQAGVFLPIKEIGLTHRDMAELTGLSRVSVTKILGLFRERGLITSQGDGVIRVNVVQGEAGSS